MSFRRRELWEFQISQAAAMTYDRGMQILKFLVGRDQEQ